MNTPVSSAHQRPLPDPVIAREWLAAMQLIRRFDERAGELYGAGQIGGFLHLATGEEATIVGAARALEDRDWLLTTYRSHAHALARGTEPSRVMAELFGRVGGVCRGRGGAMHVTDVERRFLGGFGLVGAHLPVAAGAALASTHQGRAEVTMCVLGDGAVGNGIFGESLNLTALWNLPVVLVITRGLGGFPSPGDASAASTDLQRKVEGLGVKTLSCDGMDVLDTQAVCAEAVRIARTERRPVLVEATNHRAPTVSMSDPTLRRDDKEVLAAWKARDPLLTFGDRLVSVGLLETAERARIQMQANSVIEQAVSFAGRSPHPEPAALYDEVYLTSDAPAGAWYGVDALGTTKQAEAEPHVRESGA
ncbi:MAG: thiamine pyrophosphate-dependent dehydrogenase E1 component subunit alpha [Solirubrobacteraceae bacterium]|nr:thiamine pyrophosphate-dependent dehydrogenase E1 component subunit alpha [Solirubrobacteraceae bacterium]